MEYFSKGAVEKVLERCLNLVSPSGELVCIQDKDRRSVLSHSNALGAMGLRGDLCWNPAFRATMDAYMSPFSF